MNWWHKDFQSSALPLSYPGFFLFIFYSIIFLKFLQFLKKLQILYFKTLLFLKYGLNELNILHFAGVTKTWKVLVCSTKSFILLCSAPHFAPHRQGSAQAEDFVQAEGFPKSKKSKAVQRVMSPLTYKNMQNINGNNFVE